MEETETKQQKGNVKAAGNPGEKARAAVRLPRSGWRNRAPLRVTLNPLLGMYSQSAGQVTNIYVL